MQEVECVRVCRAITVTKIPCISVLFVYNCLGHVFFYKHFRKNAPRTSDKFVGQLTVELVYHCGWGERQWLKTEGRKKWRGARVLMPEEDGLGGHGAASLGSVHQAGMG